jgi:uncharacterized membrane protein
MTGAHLHLLLNHFPIIGTLIAVAVLAVGLLRKSADLTRAGLLMLVVVAILTLPTVLTGEPAEEMVEHMPGVTRDVIHTHEEAAETAAMIMYATGIAALAALVLGWRGRTVRWLNAVVLLMGVVTFGLMARVGNLGGQVRHTEVRPGAAAPAGEPGERD